MFRSDSKLHDFGVCLHTAFDINKYIIRTKRKVSSLNIFSVEYQSFMFIIFRSKYQYNVQFIPV